MMSDKAFQVQFQPAGKRVTVTTGANLLDTARNAGIELASACGGEGNCGQCQVIILDGEVSPPTPDEEFILTEFDLLDGRRLACCTSIRSDVKVEIPRESLITDQRLQVESNLQEIDVDPVVHALHLEIRQPDLTDIRSDLTRIMDAIRQERGPSDLHASPGVIRSASRVLRENNWRVTAFVREDEIVGIGPYDTHPLGFAVDLGTTKVAAYLVDLETGVDVASKGAPNPQIGFGEDVISRLTHVHRAPEGGQVLAEKVHQTLNELLGELLREIGAEREQVVEACIVGNTAMIHLMLKLPVYQLATAPYVAAASGALDVRADELGLGMAPGAYVHIPPCIGGFVGADHVAMILACGLDHSEEVTLGIDIGTNTEISIRKPGMPFLTSVSCASGPAFEGAHITEGMRAASGAIEKVHIIEDRVELTTIGDEPPVGLCGSGIIDTVAELYRLGHINHRGRFQRQNERVREGINGAEFLLVPAGESGTGRDIVIDQKDINEIQLAKGAIHAGLKILLEVTDTPPEDVQEVIIAGAFGSFLNIENAIAMGLFPSLPKARYRQVGNAAAIGAKWMLVSKGARQRAQEITKATQYNELTTYPKFNKAFALGMLFPNKDV